MASQSTLKPFRPCNTGDLDFTNPNGFTNKLVESSQTEVLQGIRCFIIFYRNIGKRAWAEVLNDAL